METKKGRSNLTAGTCVGPDFGPPCPSHTGSPPGYDRQRPDGQLVFGNAIGNGDPTVCDLGPPPTGGGVPGNLDWLSFPAGNDVTLALQDASCKFESNVAASPSDACTLGKNGLPDFIDDLTTRQYCFVVPQTARFPVGKTIVGFQARDTRGNLGPKKEIVIEVLTDQ